MRRSPLRVAFNARYLTEYNLRGFNRYTFCLIRALQRLPDLEIELFTDQRSQIHPGFLAELESTVHTIDSRRVLLWEQRAVPKALRRRKLDVFHAPADGGVPFLKRCKYVLTYHAATDRSLLDMARAGYFRDRCVDEVLPRPKHSLPSRVLQARYEMLRFMYLRRADAIITVSEFSKNEIVRLLGVAESKIRVVHLAADESFEPKSPSDVLRVRDKFRLPRDYILFVGSFDRWKNVAGLLRAFCRLRSVLPSAPPLVLVGSDGEQNEIREYAKSLRLAVGTDVVFLGRVHDELPAIYSGATLFITLAWNETFCLPLVEAMACGVPAIAADTGAIPEVADEAALLVDPRDEDAVASAAAEVIRNEDLRRGLSHRGKIRSNKLSWGRVAEETVAVYVS